MFFLNFLKRKFPCKWKHCLFQVNTIKLMRHQECPLHPFHCMAQQSLSYISSIISTKNRLRWRSYFKFFFWGKPCTPMSKMSLNNNNGYVCKYYHWTAFNDTISKTHNTTLPFVIPFNLTHMHISKKLHCYLNLIQNDETLSKWDELLDNE